MFKNVLWTILKYSIVLVLNIPVIVYVVGNFVEVGKSEVMGKIIEHSWTEIMIDQLPIKFRALVYVAMIVGVALSYMYIKFLIKLNIENKKEQKHDNQHKELLEAVKQNRKEDRNIEKYL